MQIRHLYVDPKPPEFSDILDTKDEPSRSKSNLLLEMAKVVGISGFLGFNRFFVHTFLEMFQAEPRHVMTFKSEVDISDVPFGSIKQALHDDELIFIKHRDQVINSYFNHSIFHKNRYIFLQGCYGQAAQITLTHISCMKL